jgi:hypothetical protein
MQSQNLIYIDWNLYSILKNPELPAHILLNNFINSNSTKLTLVYSDAHLGDLSKTSSELDTVRKDDLDYLSKKTNNLLIAQYYGRDCVDVEYRNAFEFYETNEVDNSTEPLKQFIKGIKKLTDSYGTKRDDLIKNHFKTDPRNICNFTVPQLNELIKLMGVWNSLEEFLKFGLELRGNSAIKKLTHIAYYISAYMNLDMIGFYPDSMKTKGNFNNLLNDSKHSAYGSICKAFITNDNKCYYKSKLLFEYFGSKSKLIKTCKIKDISVLENNLNSLIE